LKKKTYVFDGETIKILEEIKLELGKKETQVLREAIRLYHRHHMDMKTEMMRLEKAVERIEKLADRISELSYKLGRCEEKLSRLQEEIDRLKDRP
jgi:predicted RNase H-like nuclease (RuvC/YqgF family)